MEVGGGWRLNIGSGRWSAPRWLWTALAVRGKVSPILLLQIGPLPVPISHINISHPSLQFHSHSFFFSDYNYYKIQKKKQNLLPFSLQTPHVFPRNHKFLDLLLLMVWKWTAKRIADVMMKSGGAIVEEGYVHEKEAHLTVRKTSLFFAGDGFTAYDCKGELVFRVDSYGPDAGDRGEVVLMDASGRCILTVRRKRPSLHQRWEGFIGEGTDGKKPLFSVRRSSIIGRSNLTVDVYTNPGEEYQIEGSFACRNCNIFNGEKEIVAEIRRKVDATTNVVLGKDVFVLSLRPGFDGAFAMGLVLILDQIYGADDDDDDGGSSENGSSNSKVGVDPTSEDSKSNHSVSPEG